MTNRNTQQCEVCFMMFHAFAFWIILASFSHFIKILLLLSVTPLSFSGMLVRSLALVLIRFLPMILSYRLASTPRSCWPTPIAVFSWAWWRDPPGGGGMVEWGRTSTVGFSRKIYQDRLCKLAVYHPRHIEKTYHEVRVDLLLQSFFGVVGCYSFCSDKPRILKVSSLWSLQRFSYI